jgi:hypothetical protein
MTQSNYSKFNEKAKSLEKWKPILNTMGITGKKNDWMAQYASMHSSNDLNNVNNISATQSESIDFGVSLLPVAMKIAAQTIGNNLVSVKPMDLGLSAEEVARIESEVKQENRDGKIDSIIDDTEYVERKKEDHPDWKNGGRPHVQLLYIDYKFGSTQSTTTIKKKKKK